MIVRYFAGAAEAAGATEQTVDGDTTIGDLKASLAAEHGPQFARVLGCCSLLVDGIRATDDMPAPASAVIDVLPPFAGG